MCNSKTPLQWKNLFESEVFENQYYYEESDLGATVLNSETVVKLWAPTACKVVLNLFKTGSDTEQYSEAEGNYSMNLEGKGVWVYKFPEDLSGLYYTFSVYFENDMKETGDPYAIACGINGKRSMIVNLADTDPDDWDKDKRPLIKNENRVIYEVHVKDFSNNSHSGIRKEYKGKYLAFTQKESTLDNKGKFPTCLSYLKWLGISHIHLLPVFDFGSIDETQTKTDQFNWGYDPVNYNVPEGSYCTDPWHGEVRIKEFKQMVKALHEEGIGVIMDVVYNHTYSLESVFQHTVPYYFYRLKDDGSFSDGSCCGNDTASERLMFRKYMIDSVCYWAKEYHLDGFRFDLMALHDIETMNAIRKALDELPGGKEILMYGEPWSGGKTSMKTGCFPANKANLHMLDERIAIFCDNTRDGIKGSALESEDKGYVNGKSELADQIQKSILAWYVANGEFSPRAPQQIINYVSAHDNHTLWDKLLITTKEKPEFSNWQDDIIRMNKMAAGIVFTCRGIPFFQAGEEFGRTKQGIDNSFNLSSKINELDWKRAYKFLNLMEYYRLLIRLRKEFHAFGTYDYKEEELQIITTKVQNIVGFVISNPQEDKKEVGNVVVFYNPANVKINVELPEGKWRVLTNQDSSRKEENILMEKEYSLTPKSVTILAKYVQKPTFVTPVMIEVKNITKEFISPQKYSGLGGAIKGLFSNKKIKKIAVNDISFSIDTGEIVGYIGSNGAGKSTTIKMMTGILTPTKGECLIDGVNPSRNRKENAQNIGVVFGQRTQLWWDLPLSESFTILKEIYNISNEKYIERMAFLNRVLELEEFWTRPVRNLSLGQRMRADLGAALLHNPKVLYLDEPTIGLDLVVKDNIRKAIKEINEKYRTTVVLTTHDIVDIEELCNRIIIIDGGRKIYDGSLWELKDKYGTMRTVTMEVKNPKEAAHFNLAEKLAVSKESYRIEVDEENNIIVVSFDKNKMHVSDIIEQFMKITEVRDIKIQETELSEIIKGIYNYGV